MAQLRALLGPLQSKVFPLGSRPVVIGRDPKADVALPLEGSASRRHAELKCIDGEWRIRDLASKNGTIVNGRAVGERVLSDEDEITIGDNVFIFEATTPATKPLKSA